VGGRGPHRDHDRPTLRRVGADVRGRGRARDDGHVGEPNRIAETMDHPRRGDSVSRSGVGWGPRAGFAGLRAGLHQARRQKATHGSASRRSMRSYQPIGRRERGPPVIARGIQPSSSIPRDGACGSGQRPERAEEAGAGVRGAPRRRSRARRASGVGGDRPVHGRCVEACGVERRQEARVGVGSGDALTCVLEDALTCVLERKHAPPTVVSAGHQASLGLSTHSVRRATTR
jgi:hypothetical protein